MATRSRTEHSLAQALAEGIRLDGCILRLRAVEKWKVEAGLDAEQKAATGPVAYTGLAVDYNDSVVDSPAALVASAVEGSMLAVAQNY